MKALCFFSDWLLSWRLRRIYGKAPNKKTLTETSYDCFCGFDRNIFYLFIFYFHEFIRRLESLR